MKITTQKEIKKSQLIKELEKGEKSGMVKDFNRSSFIDKIHEKHIRHKS